MDQVLLSYLEAHSDSERQDHLDELLLLYAAPVVRQTLRNKLGFSIDLTGANPHNPDAQDLYQEIMTRLVQALNELTRARRKTGIDDFRKYVSGVAVNVCRDYLRARSPGRRRLKDNIRLVLNRHPDFEMWQTEAGHLCGFAVWRKSGTPPTWSLEAKSLAAKIEQLRSTAFAKEHPARLALPRILSKLFEWTGKPLEFDTAVKTVTTLMSLRDQPDESFDEETYGLFEAPTRDLVTAQSLLEEKELLRRLWEAVKTLPVEQRDTYCLLFHDRRGWDLFSLLIEAEIVSLAGLARALNRSPQEITRLRSQMPMDGPTLAAELNVSRPQVNKWRFRAVRNVRRELQMLGKENKSS